MKIDIVSRDKRYAYLNQMLTENGFNSNLAMPDEAQEANVLILSVRDELTDSELKQALNNLSPQALVLTGNGERIKKYYDGRVIDYSKNEDFLLKNAYLTAEAMVSLWHSVVCESPSGKRILICGYGRIGKYLAKIFSSLRAKIYIYARREEVREQIKKDGYTPVLLDFSSQADSVFNTVPSLIFSSAQIEKIPLGTLLFELASKDGFEDTQRVIFAKGLPGKILPLGAGRAIYDTILPFLVEERTI